MGRLRYDITVESIDFSVLCFDDGSVDAIQVYQGRRKMNDVWVDTYRDIEWMLTTSAIEAIEAKLAQVIADEEADAAEYRHPLEQA